MPALPWIALARADDSGEFVVVATRFDLTSRLHMGRVFSAAQALMSTFAETAGLTGYSLKADIVRGSLWTLSAWSTRSHMREFVRGAAHTMAVNTTAEWMRHSSFVTWVEPAGAETPSWDQATRLMRERASGGAHPMR